jgi:hypothetical protein
LHTGRREQSSSLVTDGGSRIVPEPDLRRQEIERAIANTAWHCRWLRSTPRWRALPAPKM